MRSPLPTITAHPSTPPNVLQPRATEPPSSYCPPNTLVIQVSTTLVVRDYKRWFAPMPIEQYKPKYASLQDGSLLTDALTQDMRDSYISLFVLGALSIVFFRNILLSGSYLSRVKVKNKSLFYLLFLSQLLAPAGLLPTILSYFREDINCTAAIMSTCLSGATSLAILITGILGAKAYRCLNNARWVLGLLVLFQAASTAVVVIDIRDTQGARRLTGSCTRLNDIKPVQYFVTIQFLESLFLCGCFLFVCWKSRSSLATRGRLSLQLSMEDMPIEVPDDPPDQNPARRGWWDYVPEKPQAATVNADVKSTRTSILSKKKNQARSNSTNTLNSKPSRKTETAVTTIGLSGKPPSRRRVSLAPSTMSRLSKLIPRVQVFHEVMKDEMFYTTFITMSCVIVAVMSMIGVNFQNGLSVIAWIALHWGTISLLTIHSFGRVVHRHEREALLHDPINCAAITQAAVTLSERRTTKAARSRDASLFEDSEKASTMGDVAKVDDPFADRFAPHPNNPFQHPSLDDSTDAVQPSSPSWRRIRISFAQESISTSPVSKTQDFPTSSPATPTVPIDPSRPEGRKAFSGSLFFSAASVSSAALPDDKDVEEEPQVMTAKRAMSVKSYQSSRSSASKYSRT